MGIYAQYNIFPFSPHHKKFVTPGGGLDIFSESDVSIVYKTMREKSKNFIGKQDAKKIQNSLNLALQKNFENYEKLIDKIIHQLNNENYEKLYQLGVIKRKQGTFSLNISAANQYSQEVKEIASHLSGYQEDDEMRTVISRLSGSLNKTRGDIFENFLAVVLNNASDSIANISNVAEESLINSFTETIEKMGKGNNKVIKKNQKSYSSKNAKVIGAELKDDILISIGNNQMSISGSQGKSDIIIEGLSGPLGISAKNYQGASRKVSLLSEANLGGLISQWPGIKDYEKNLAMNGLSAINISESQFQIMKKLFMVQGLMGTENEDIKAQLFIVNKNTGNEPIIVMSIYDLLFNNNIEGDFSGTDLKPISDLPRSNNKFIAFIRSAKITIHTQLKISELRKLTK